MTAAPPSALAGYAIAVEDRPPAWSPPTIHRIGAVEVQVRTPSTDPASVAVWRMRPCAQVQFSPGSHALQLAFLGRFPGARTDWLNESWWTVRGATTARRVRNWLDAHAVRAAERERAARVAERAARVMADDWD